MTIRKGQDWGSPFVMPSECLVAASDADAARSEPQAPFYVSNGDLHEALGKPRQPIGGEECQLLPIDAMKYTIEISDGKELSAFAISSISIGRWYRGAFFVLSNTGFYQSRHLLPRAHPNDGFLDLLSLRTSMPLRQRLLFKRKSRISAHLPHPDIRIERVDSFTFTRTNANESLIIDGIGVSKWASISVAVRADYWHTVV
jgi:hypothetical protein